MLFVALPRSLVSSILVAVILVFLLWPVANHVQLIIWFHILLGALGYRAIHLRKYLRSSSTQQQDIYWISRFRFGAMIAAACWTGAGIWFFPEGSPVHQFSLVMIFASIFVGAITSLYHDLVLLLLFILSIILPIIFMLVVEGGLLAFSMIGLLLVFVAHQTPFAFQLSDTQRQNFLLLRNSQKREKALAEAIEKGASALVAKNSFLSNMGHEIRTPMNAILGFTEIMLRNETTSKQKECLNVILDSGEYLLGIINDLVEISRVGSGQLALALVPFQLNELTTTVIEMFKSKTKLKKLEFHAPEPLIPPIKILGDIHRLQKILFSLAGNAIKFTEKGTVSFLIEVIDQKDQQITLKFLVEDTGSGISSEEQKDLFEPFHQVDSSRTRKHGGVGLQLALAQHLVRSMGGEIKVKSQVGKGSLFYFVLNFDLVKEEGFTEPWVNEKGTVVDVDQDSNVMITKGTLHQLELLLKQIQAFDAESEARLKSIRSNLQNPNLDKMLLPLEAAIHHFDYEQGEIILKNILKSL